MLNDPRSHGLWEKTAPQPPVTAPLTGSVQADVVVVGGGYTGISSALHLAEAGSKVVLLEAKEIGFGLVGGFRRLPARCRSDQCRHVGDA